MNLGWLEIVVGSLFVVVVLTVVVGRGKSWLEPRYWRNAAIISVLVMTAVLLFLTFDSLKQISVGSNRVPAYTVINDKVEYVYDNAARHYVPKITADNEGLFGKVWSASESYDLINHGKKTIQSRSCMDCHTLLGNGAYYAPDLTKAWLDPKWKSMIMGMTATKTKEDAMVKWLQDPGQYPTWARRMPNLHLTEDEARSVVAYLKFMSAIDTSGFPDRFGASAGK